MKQYILAMDGGTTSSRCLIFDKQGALVAKAAKEFSQHFPAPGWVEHDATEIFDTQLAVAKEALLKAGLTAADIAAIGITNQRETTVVWEKASGKPICPAIVWQCRRTEERCQWLRENGYETTIKEKTGLAPDPYFSATKLQWILDNVRGARERAERGELLFGTVDSWLLYCFTGGRVHATDPSNAARTMLFNIHTLTWDEELLSLFGIPSSILPQVLPTVGFFGETAPHLFGASIPIMGMAGDQQAALFGQGCFEAGDAKNTYGTGGFLLMNTGRTPVRSENGLLTTVGWQIGKDTTYVLEGSVFVCGSAIQWLRDNLSLFASTNDVEALARTVPDSGGVYFVPAFVGLGTPYWQSDVRGTLCGLTRGTTKAHIVRATLEAMAYQTADVLFAMKRDTGLEIPSLYADGGAAKNDLLLQLQSDYAGVFIVRRGSVESTAFGVCGMAGMAAGVFADTKHIASLLSPERTFTPCLDEKTRTEKLAVWQRAVGAAIAFSKQ